MNGQMTIEEYIDALVAGLSTGDRVRTHGDEISFESLGKKVGERVLVRDFGSTREWIVGEVRAVIPSLKGDDMKAIIFTGDMVRTFFETEALQGRNVICEMR